MTPEEIDADVRSWRSAAPRIAPPLRIPPRPVGHAAHRPDANHRSRKQEWFQAEEALRQLRMERARQAYERRFGRPVMAGPSMTAQGQGADVDALLQRVKLARQSGWRPGRT